MIKGEIAPGDSGVTTHRSETDDFEENVLDYANSCMISFITLGYVSDNPYLANRRWLGSQRDLQLCLNLT